MEVRCNNYRDPFGPHYIGYVGDDGFLHVPCTVLPEKDYPTGLFLWAMQGRAKRARRQKPADYVPIASNAAMSAAWIILEGQLSGQRPGTNAKCVVEGIEFTGSVATVGSISIRCCTPGDRPTDSMSMVPTPCILRCWCKSIVTIRPAAEPKT